MKKKERKKDDVDHAFEEARAYAEQDTRQYHQSASLEALFEVYFRVLKHATGSGLIARREGEGWPRLARACGRVARADLDGCCPAPPCTGIHRPSSPPP